MDVYREIKTVRLNIHYMHLRPLFCHNIHYFFLIFLILFSCQELISVKIKEDLNVFLILKLHTLMLFSSRSVFFKEYTHTTWMALNGLG